MPKTYNDLLQKIQKMPEELRQRVVKIDIDKMVDEIYQIYQKGGELPGHWDCTFDWEDTHDDR